LAARYAACLCPAEQYSLDRPPPCPVRRTTGAHLVRASVANDGWQLPSRVELAPTRDGMTPMAARQQKGITAGYVGRPRELNLVAPTWAALPPSSAVCDQPFRSNPQTNPRHKSRMRVHLPCKVEDDLAARRRGRERSERPQAPSCQSAQLLTRRWGDASSSGLCLGLGSVGEPNGWLQTAEDGGKAAQTGESRCGSCVGKRIRRAMLFCCLAAISAGPADALALCVARWQRTAGSARHAPGGVAERSEALDLGEPDSAESISPGRFGARVVTDAADGER
jgi:hypothetical protein